MSRLLADLGHEVYVANPRRLRAIYENENKSDRVDAQYLARIGRLDPALLYPLRHRSAETQADLTLLRSRAALVKVRANLANFMRGVVKSAG
jgi:transposase